MHQSGKNKEGGWYDRCDDLVARGAFGPNGEKYSTQEECLIENSDYIDQDVDALYGIMDAQNTKIKQIQDKYKEEGELFSDDIIDGFGNVIFSTSSSLVSHIISTGPSWVSNTNSKR